MKKNCYKNSILSNKNQLAVIKNRRLAPYFKFFDLGFVDNEKKYGYNLTAEALTTYGHSVTSKLSLRETTVRNISFFFNPKFKFGFAYSQLADDIFDHDKFFANKKYRFSVTSSFSNFVSEQENNVFLHYATRSGVFNATTVLNIELGAQHTLPSYFRNTYVADDEARLVLSSNVKSIKDYYYKKKLSTCNWWSGPYRALINERLFFNKSPVFSNGALSLKHKRHSFWALKREWIVRLWKKRDVFRRKVWLKRKFLKDLIVHWNYFLKMRGAFYERRKKGYKSKKKIIITNEIISKLYSYAARTKRKRRVVGTSVYKKNSIQPDFYWSFIQLKRSLNVNVLFNKKIQRRASLRFMRKSLY